MNIDIKKALAGVIFSFIMGTSTGVCGSFLWESYKDEISERNRHIFNGSASTDALNGHNKIVEANILSQRAYAKAEASSAYKEGIRLLTSSAEAGIPSAMRDIGLLYCAGREGFVPRELAKGMFWLAKASAAGDNFAAAGLCKCL